MGEEDNKPRGILENIKMKKAGVECPQHLGHRRGVWKNKCALKEISNPFGTHVYLFPVYIRYMRNTTAPRFMKFKVELLKD